MQTQLMYNPRSGFFIDQAELSATDCIHKLLQDCGATQVQPQVLDLSRLAALEASWQQEKPPAVWVMGGDGTVLALASITAKLNIPLGILPGGTMNLLARDLGIALDIRSAIQQLLTASVTYIDMAEVNGQPFLCSSNLGVTTRITQCREELRHTHRWIRWPLVGWHLFKYLLVYPSMHIHVELNDGRSQRWHSRAVLISNNLLSGTDWLIPQRAKLDQGVLGVYVTHGDSFWTLPRLAFKTMTGDWQEDDELEVFQTQHVVIKFRLKRKINLMFDGEIKRFKTPLDYRLKPAALPVLKPQPNTP